MRQLYVLLLFFVISTPFAVAQKCQVIFGPPLRNNIVFAYKYTERVRVVMSAAGAPADTSQRMLTYFITQRQLPSPTRAGAWQIEANVDSMRLDYSSPGDSIHFDSQVIGETMYDVGHREVLVPSALVNRMVVFTLSPYGELISATGPVVDDLRRQVLDPTVDAFTRGRVEAMLDEDALAAIYLPGRAIVPGDQTVACGAKLVRKVSALLDRVPFTDSASLAIWRDTTSNLPGRANKPTLRFEGSLRTPSHTVVTLKEIRDPLTLVSANATISGELMLDDDGVVLSGWTAAKGSHTSTIDGLSVTSVVSHESFVELMGMSPVVSN